MLTNEPTKSYIFISYHHDDNPIAVIIHDELQTLASKGRGKDALCCFLDSHPDSIPDGKRWEPIITENIGITDWLLALYTGNQSEYCGFELGTFSTLNKLGTPSATPEKHLVCLYDTELTALPALFHPYKNHRVPLTPSESTDWFKSPVGIFLDQFCRYRRLYTPEDSPTTYAADIARSAARITASFADNRANDQKEETATQLGISVRIDPSRGEIFRIPDSALVVGSTLTFNIFSLNFSFADEKAPQTTWGTLRNKILSISGGTSVPWMDKIETDISLAVNNITLSGDDVTFLGNGKVYRPILVRHKLYYSGKRKFYILFVETFDRRFVGRRQTSLLLTTLIMASRLRFTYFEDWEKTTTKTFGSAIPLPMFGDSIKQLRYNLEWMEHEAVDHGLNDRHALVEAFGEDLRARIERFYDDWDNSKRTLLHGLPSSNTVETEEVRTQARAVILQFLEDVRKQNAEYLEICLDRYGREMMSEIRRDDLSKGG